MLGLEPPIRSIAFERRRKERRSTQQQNHRCSRRRQYYDYMDVPSSMMSSPTDHPLNPIFPWEMKEAEARSAGHGYTDGGGGYHGGNNSINNAIHRHHPNNSTRRQSGLNHRPFLTVLLLVSLALAAGTFLDGGDHTNSTSSSSSSSTKVGKERGAFLPAASSKQEGIAQDMFQVYQTIKEDYQNRAFHPSQLHKWKVLNQKNKAKVSLLEHDSDPTCPYVKLEATIPASVATCWDFLSIQHWNESARRFTPI